ncbi:MAG: sulfate permease [Candidatus Nanopelagicales bacterium]
MFRLITNVTTRVRWFLRCYAPSNIALDAIRSRRDLKWGIPAALVAVPTYLYAASFASTLIERGGPGWLNLVVLTLIWSALKFGVMAPVSVGLLVRARLVERSPRRCQQFVSMGYAPGRGVGPWTST